MSKTLLDITFVCVGASPSLDHINNTIPICHLAYQPNPHDKTQLYSYLKGTVELTLDKAIPCNTVKLIEASIRGTHSSTNDTRAGFHMNIDCLKTFNVQGNPLHNSFLVEAGVNNDQTKTYNPITFTTAGEGFPRKFNITLQGVQWTDTLGSAEFGSDDAFVVNLKFEVPVERI